MAALDPIWSLLTTPTAVFPSRTTTVIALGTAEAQVLYGDREENNEVQATVQKSE